MFPYEWRQRQNRNQSAATPAPPPKGAVSRICHGLSQPNHPYSPTAPKSGGRESLPVQNKNPPEPVNKPPEPTNRTPKSSQIARLTLQTKELWRHTPGFSPINRKQAKTPSGACHRSTPRPPETSIVTSTQMYPAEPTDNPAHAITS